MRFVNMFLTGYFVLIIGAVLALWHMGVLIDLASIWIVIGVLVAVGLGMMMAISSGRPATVIKM
jgi:hypothetical protein